LVEPLEFTIQPRSPKLHYISTVANVGPMLARNVYAAFRLSTCVQTILNPPAKRNVVDLAAHR
jgi:hypothetical protein